MNELNNELMKQNNKSHWMSVLLSLSELIARIAILPICRR